MEKWKLLLFVFIVGIGLALALSSISNFYTGWGGNIQTNEILAGMGMFGAALAIVGIVYGAETVKQGDYMEAFKNTFMLEIVALSLIIAWLWSSV